MAPIVPGGRSLSLEVRAIPCVFPNSVTSLAGYGSDGLSSVPENRLESWNRGLHRFRDGFTHL